MRSIETGNPLRPGRRTGGLLLGRPTAGDVRCHLPLAILALLPNGRVAAGELVIALAACERAAREPHVAALRYLGRLNRPAQLKVLISQRLGPFSLDRLFSVRPLAAWVAHVSVVADKAHELVQISVCH